MKVEQNADKTLTIFGDFEAACIRSEERSRMERARKAKLEREAEQARITNPPSAPRPGSSPSGS